MNFDSYMPGKIIFGNGRIKEVTDNIKQLGNKAFIATSLPEDLDILQSVLKLLDSNAVEYHLFTDVVPNPTSVLIDKAAEVFKKKKCDYLVGLGGGSSIDFAKGVAIAAAHTGEIWNYVYLDYRDAVEITDVTYPVVAIPTTSGTGAEVTKYAVVTNTKTHEKSFLGSDYIAPKIIIIDPELTIGLPKRLTASTGIDALSHAVESFININSNPYSEVFAREAIKIIPRYLPEAVSNGSNIYAREKMAMASTFAGIALNHAGATLVHSMGHVLSGRFDLDHGITMAVSLEPVIRNSWTSNIEKFAELTELFGKDISNLTLKEAAEASSVEFKKLIKQVDLDLNLTDLGVKKDMVDILVDDIFKYTKGMQGVHPKVFTKQEVKKLFLSMF